MFKTKFFRDLTLFLTQNFFGPKIHLKMECDSGVGPTCFDKKEPKGGLRMQGRRGLWVSKFQHLKLGPLWGQLQKVL